MSVIVLGSINMDLVVRASRFAQVGETILGQTFHQAPGGKGANQAVAAARLGVYTRLIGKVGQDNFGAALRQHLLKAGVDTSLVEDTSSASSGVALITLADNSQNTIIVVQGANGQVGVRELARLQSALAGAATLLLQLEIPLATVTAAARQAASAGVKVILDPAPAPIGSLPLELLSRCYVITPNQTEAAALVGYPLDDHQAITRAGQDLLRLGVECVIIKLGGQGIYWTDGEVSQFKPAFPVQVVDTVAAGDAFNGALAAALSEGHPFEEALDWGRAAGALAVSRPGAQSAMPSRTELLNMLAEFVPD